MKQLETKRLIIREWEDSDSADLFEYGRDPQVGPNAGWSPHVDEEESKRLIKMFKETGDYAVVHKDDQKVIGGMGLFKQEGKPDSVREIGYVLNPKYWGKGLMPEAVEEMKRYGFEDLGLTEIWCGHFEFNMRSKRVVEKCGFVYDHTEDTVLERLDNQETQTLFYKITREDYFK